MTMKNRFHHDGHEGHKGFLSLQNKILLRAPRGKIRLAGYCLLGALLLGSICDQPPSPPKPRAPALLAPELGFSALAEEGVRLSWTHPGEAEEYFFTVERARLVRTAAGDADSLEPWQAIATDLPAAQRRFLDTDPGLFPSDASGRRWCYRLFAVIHKNRLSDDSLSDPSNQDTIQLTVPPAFLAATWSTETLTLSWEYSCGYAFTARYFIGTPDSSLDSGYACTDPSNTECPSTIWNTQCGGMLPLYRRVPSSVVPDSGTCFWWVETENPLGLSLACQPITR